MGDLTLLRILFFKTLGRIDQWVLSIWP